MKEEDRDLLNEYYYHLFPIVGMILRMAILPKVIGGNFWVQPLSTVLGLAVWLIMDRKPSRLAWYALVSFIAWGADYTAIPNTA